MKDPLLINASSPKTQSNITNKSQEASPFPAGDHKAAKHDKHKTSMFYFGIYHLKARELSLEMPQLQTTYQPIANKGSQNIVQA